MEQGNCGNVTMQQCKNVTMEQRKKGAMEQWNNETVAMLLCNNVNM